MSLEKRKILQIMPAKNTFAIFGESDSDKEDHEEAVICLALIEIEGDRPGSRTHYSVEPMIYDGDCGSCYADEFPNYKGLKIKGP